jgi:hypothetical protein
VRSSWTTTCTKRSKCVLAAADSVGGWGGEGLAGWGASVLNVLQPGACAASTSPCPGVKDKGWQLKQMVEAAMASAEPTWALAARRLSILWTTAAARCTRAPNRTVYSENRFAQEEGKLQSGVLAYM